MNKSHLIFISRPNGKRKTLLFNVNSLQTGEILGKVYWEKGWRQYVFEPTDEFSTIWSASCVNEIYVFLTKLNLEHKNNKI